MVDVLLSHKPVALKGEQSGHYLQIRPRDGSFTSTHLVDDNLEEPLRLWRNWERVIVVDAGDGQVSIYSPVHHCYLRIDGSATVKPPRQSHFDIPANWNAEKFVIETHPGPAGPASVSFRNKDTGTLLTVLGDSSFIPFTILNASTRAINRNKPPSQRASSMR